MGSLLCRVCPAEEDDKKCCDERLTRRLFFSVMHTNLSTNFTRVGLIFFVGERACLDSNKLKSHIKFKGFAFRYQGIHNSCTATHVMNICIPITHHDLF
jgi:hypothetical protein